MESLATQEKLKDESVTAPVYRKTATVETASELASLFGSNFKRAMKKEALPKK